MTTGVLLTPPIVQFTFNNGQLAAGGYMAPTVGGISTAVYQDSGLTTPLPLVAIPNQIVTGVPLNSRGEPSNAAGTSCQVFLTPNQVYVMTFFDTNGNQVWQGSYVNGVQISQAIIGQTLYPQTAAELAAGVTPTNYSYASHVSCGYVLLERYGGAGDGVTVNNAAFASASLVAGQVDAPIGITQGTTGVWKFTAGLVLSGTGQAFGGGGPPVGGVGATGARLEGLRGTPVLSFSGLSTSTDCLTVGGSNLPQVVLRNLQIQCNGSSGSPQGRDGIVCLGSNMPIYENITVLNSQRHAFSRTISGTNFIEKMTMRQCRGIACGQHFLFDSLSGSGGAYINECIYDQLEARGVSAITSGGNAHRMTSTASGGGSKFSNHFFAKTNFDCRWAGGAPTPDVNVVNIDSGTAQNFSYVCGGWENTAAGGSPGAGTPIAVTGTGVWGGLFFAGMLTNSLWGAGQIPAAITQANVFDFSFNVSQFVGPAALNVGGSSLGSKPGLAISGQTTASAQSDIQVVRTGSNVVAIGQNASITLGNSTTGTFVTVQEQNGSIALWSFSGGNWGQRAVINANGGIQLGTAAAGATTLPTIYPVNGGAPSAGLGSNGDYAFRQDTPGTANQRIYVKSAGAWVGIV